MNVAKNLATYESADHALGCSGNPNKKNITAIYDDWFILLIQETMSYNCLKISVRNDLISDRIIFSGQFVACLKLKDTSDWPIQKE